MSTSICRNLVAALLVVSAPAFAGGDEGGWSYDDHFRFELPESNFELDIFNLKGEYNGDVKFYGNQAMEEFLNALGRLSGPN